MAFAAPIAIGAAVAGTALSAYGSYEAGQAQKGEATYQAAVARNNEQIANQNANYAEQAGRAKAEAQGLKGAATGGHLKASQAASGIEVNTGSAVDTQVSQREGAQLDTETVMSNSNLQAYGYRTQATNFEAEAGLKDTEAAQAETAGDIGAVSSLLSGASGTAFKWQQAYGGGGGSGAATG